LLPTLRASVASEARSYMWEAALLPTSFHTPVASKARSYMCEAALLPTSFHTLVASKARSYTIASFLVDGWQTQPIPGVQVVLVQIRFGTAWLWLPVVLPANERRHRHQDGFGTAT
jgi:hypothetical protein